MNTFMGLGDVVMQAPVMTTTLKQVSTTPATTVAKPSVWDTINNVITKVAQPAANVYTQIKTNVPASQSSSGYVYPTPSTGDANLPGVGDQVKKDNTMKYVLIGGTLVLVATGIYFATKKKRK